MRLAFISLMMGSEAGGSEVLWLETASAALDGGHDVFVSVAAGFGGQHPAVADLARRGAVVELRDDGAGHGSLARRLVRRIGGLGGRVRNRWRALSAFGPDRIFINQPDNFSLLIYFRDLCRVLQESRTPYQLICHNHRQYSQIPGENIYPYGRAIFLGAEVVYFVSRRQWSLTERRLCARLPNAAIAWSPMNLEEPRYLGFPGGQGAQFAIVGALVTGKGHDTLFEVFAGDEWKSRDWQLNIYGKGYGLGYLADLATFLRLGDRVAFHGHVASATGIWERNHVLLIPSEQEGLPISLCEAMISGRPAVVTDVGGNTELVDDENGFIAPSPTVSSFAGALEKAWRERSRWEPMGLAARERALGLVDRNPAATLLRALERPVGRS